MSKSRSAILFVFLATSAFGQPPTPDTPVGRVLAAWMAAFNSADPEALRAFDATYRRQSRPVSSSLAFREWTGGFTLVRLEQSEPLSLAVLLKERNSDQLGRLHLGLASEQAPNIVREELLPIPYPPELAIPRLREAAALAALSDAAGKAAREDRFSGVVLVARHGKVLLEKGWGLANRDTGVPVSLDTPFDTASITKMFTAVATLQLIEAGRLRLDDVVEKYLPDYPNADVASKVTVRHLLTHTGGTGDVFSQDLSTLREHGDYVRVFGTRGALFEPGTQYRYSNYGFVLLGVIVEKVSGLSYYDYVQRRIFEPSGMKATDFLPRTEISARHAVGYARQDGAWVARGAPWGRGMAFGGAHATVRDLFRFADALESGRLISKTTLANATLPHQEHYGYGFNIEGEGTLRYYGHPGGTPGRNGDVRIYPQLGYVLIGLTNLGPPLAERIIDVMANRMPASP